MRPRRSAALLLLLVLGAASQSAAPSPLPTADGAQCGVPFIYDPDEAAIYALDKNYAPTEYRDCTYDGSAIFEPWCSTGPPGIFAGSWGTCAPGELFHNEAQDHSLYFSGQSGAILESEQTYELEAGITLELWLRPSGLNQANTMTQYAIAMHGTFRLGLFGASNELAYTADGLHPPAIGGAAGSGAPMSGNVLTEAELDYGAWTHVALVYDGARLECFADGRRVDSRAAVGRIARRSGRVSLGGDPANPAATFHGALDEVRIWAAARTQRALVGNMLQPLRPADIARARLLAYWPILDGDSAQGVKDVAAPSHTALPDNAWWAPPPELTLRPLPSSRWGLGRDGGTGGLLDGMARDAAQQAQQAQQAGDMDSVEQDLVQRQENVGTAPEGSPGEFNINPELVNAVENNRAGWVGNRAGSSAGGNTGAIGDGGRRGGGRRLQSEGGGAAAGHTVANAAEPFGALGQVTAANGGLAPLSELAHLVKDFPFRLEALGGSKLERLPFARALGGSEIVLRGEAGTHMIAPGSSGTLALKARGTIELWVLPGAHNAQNAPRMALVTKDASYAIGLTSHKLALWYVLGGRARAKQHRGSRHAAEDPATVLESCAVREGVWSHVALAFDRSGVYAYVDGVECARDSGAKGGDLTMSPKPVEVGGQLLRPDASFAGALDEVRIWRVARKPEQLQALMLDTLRADVSYDDRTEGLLASYGFSEGRGRTVRAAHGVGKAQEPQEARELVIVGSAFAWRLGTSPAALIAGATDDPEPTRFALAFSGLAGSAARSAEGVTSIHYGDGFCFEAWFAWHGPNADRTSTQVVAQDTGAFTVAIDGADGDGDAELRVSVIGTSIAAGASVGVRVRRGVWYHVSLSRDLRGRRANGGTASLLINGSPIQLGSVRALSGTARTGEGGLPVSATVLGNSDGGSLPFRGALHEVRLWNEARDAQETWDFHLSRLLLDSDDDERILPAKPLGAKLHAYWPLDEGHGESTLDRSGHARRLELYGPEDGVWWSRATSPVARAFDGRYASGYALGFGSCGGLQGSTHVAVPGSDSIHLRGGMSAEAWLNLGSETDAVVAPLPGEAAPAEPAPAERTRRRVIMSRAGVFELGIAETGELFISIFGKEHARSMQPRVRGGSQLKTGNLVPTADNKYREDLSGPEGPDGGASTHSSLVDWDVPVGQWTHVAFSLNQSGAVLMLNGAVVLDVLHGMGDPKAHKDVPLLLGASDAQATGIPTDRFCGQLDEVRVWSSYRSAATIRQEYTTTVLPPLRAMRGDKGGTRERMPDAISTKDKDLVLCFSMDAGYGAKVIDSSQHNNHGMINGPTVHNGGGGGFLGFDGGGAGTNAGFAGNPGGADEPAGQAAHAWTLSGALVDDANNGYASLGYAIYFDGSSKAGAVSRKSLRKDSAHSSKAFTVQLLAQYDGANSKRSAQVLVEDQGAFSLALEPDGEIVWRLAGVRLDTARFLKAISLAEGRGGPALAGGMAAELTQMTATGCYRTGARLVPSSKWRQLALVYSGRFVSLVLDGALTYEAPVQGSLRPEEGRVGSIGVQLGGSLSNHDHSFRGALDEVALWAEARSVAQVSTEHLSLLLLQPRGGKAGAKNVPKKMLAYWPMNDGWGKNIADATGRGYDCVGNKRATWLASTAPSPGETRMCTTEGIRCEPAFAYKGKTYFGCTGDHRWGGQPWCYTDEARKIWGSCATTCDLVPGGGFPGHFTSVGYKTSWFWNLLIVLSSLAAIVFMAGFCILGVQHLMRGGAGRPFGSGRPITCVLPFSMSDLREACEGVADRCTELFHRGRSAASERARARGGVGSSGGGFGPGRGSGGGRNGYGRNYDHDDHGVPSPGYRDGVAMSDKPSAAEGGVRSSIASRDASAFQQFQAEDDML